jgi:hypothetical protein
MQIYKVKFSNNAYDNVNFMNISLFLYEEFEIILFAIENNEEIYLNPYKHVSFIN